MHTAAPFDTSSLARIPVRGSAPSGEGREPDGRTEADCRPMVSVVLPAYNEAGIIEKNIEVLCRYLRGVEPAYRWELVIVNDGSVSDLSEATVRFWEDHVQPVLDGAPATGDHDD